MYRPFSMQKIKEGRYCSSFSFSSSMEVIYAVKLLAPDLSAKAWYSSFLPLGTRILMRSVFSFFQLSI